MGRPSARHQARARPAEQAHRRDRRPPPRPLAPPPTPARVIISTATLPPPPTAGPANAPSPRCQSPPTSAEPGEDFEIVSRAFEPENTAIGGFAIAVLYEVRGQVRNKCPVPASAL